MATKLTKAQKEALTEKVTGLIKNSPALRMTTDSSVNEMNINQISGELNRIHYRAIGKDLPASINIPISYSGYYITGIGFIYEGVLDVESGQLTVSYNKITFNGSETWTKSTTALNGFYCTRPADAKRYGRLYNSWGYAFTTNLPTYLNNYGYVYSDNSFNINIDPQICGDSVATFTEYLQQNNITLIYELGTALTYTLSPEQMVQLLDQI